MSLSRERIVAAAIELLDAEDESGLTFRALAARLETGAGAIYWHIENKEQLLAAATDAVVLSALDAAVGTTPRKAIHAIALGVFDAVDAHPWIGAQLWRAPQEAATLQIFERLGRQLEALGVAANARFTAASVLLSYVVGVSIQNAANAQWARRQTAPALDRTAYLAAVAARWKELDADAYRFTRTVVDHLRQHDDRAEYLAGIDLVLSGIAPKKPSKKRS